MTTVRDLFEGDRPSRAIQGSDCGALRQQRAQLADENAKLRLALGVCVYSLEKLAPVAGEHRPLVDEALYGARPLLKT